MKTLISGVCVLLSVSSGFSSVSSDYAKDASFAQGLNIGEQTENIDLTSIPNYTNNPSQTKYVNNQTAILQDTQKAILNPGTANTVLTAAGERPQYVINPKSPEIVRSTLVAANADALSHGISTQAVLCIQPSSCKVTHHIESCVSNNIGTLACTLTLVPKVVEVPYQVSMTETGTITRTSATGGDFYLPESGVITDFSIGVGLFSFFGCVSANIMLDNTLMSPNNVNCSIFGSGLSFNQSDLAIQVNQSNAVQFQLVGWRGDWGVSQYTLKMNVTRYRPEIQIDVQNTCGSIPAYCKATQNTCLVGGGTKILDGIPVTEPCWQTNQYYSCGLSGGDTCGALQNEGCSQLSGSCIQSFDGTCLQYQDTYTCDTQSCSGQENICGGQYFCIDGGSQCYEDSPTQNQKFGKDDAEMAAAANAAQSIFQNQGSLLAFGGDAMSCSVAPLGVLNCCADSGWGKGALLQCSTEEQKLGLARENHTASYVGTYCAHSFMGICTSTRESYCVFPGILARDVQEQGRVDQLGIGFGDPRNPDCMGLTVQQLQAIDFSKINFSNAVDQVEGEANFPNSQTVSNQIAQKIKNELG
jgi:conjugal transfer mating pair stabilization protein TraN